MSRIAAKRIPRLFTNERKLNRKDISQGLFGKAETDQKNSITNTNLWILRWNKASIIIVEVGMTKPSKVGEIKCDSGVHNMFLMFVGWFVVKGCLKVEQLTSSIFIWKSWKGYMKMLRKTGRKNGFCVLHRDNAPAHSSLPVWLFLANDFNSSSVTNTTLVRPRAIKFFMFTKLKSTYNRRCFQTIDGIEQNTETDLKDIPLGA